MKRKMMMKLFGSAVVVAFAVTAHGATGSSAWFFVDTTDAALMVSDVTSSYFDGEYGGVGRKATFLSGVSCDVEMTILDDPVNVDHWLVNGREITTRTFIFDVGSLPVGGRLEVVAVGKNDGVRSKPFRANFDVAAVPSALSAIGSLTLHAQEHPDEVVYGTFPLDVEIELASSRDASISALDWDWLPQKTVKVSPKVSFRTEIGSNGNGMLRWLQTDFAVDKSKSILGTQLTATWDAKTLQWKFQSVTFGMGISGKCETPPWYCMTTIGPFYGKMSAEANISALCEVSGLDMNGILGANLSLSSKQFPAIIGTGGYGIKGNF